MTRSAPRVEASVLIRAARETVFDAWLTRERMARLLAFRANVSAAALSSAA